jgi:hypothetical protein
MGYVMGALAEPDVSDMATTFVDHIVIELVDNMIDEKLINSTLYDALCALFMDMIVHQAVDSFYQVGSEAVWSGLPW